MDGTFIQYEAAEALLDAGVSVPLKDLWVPFRKKPMVVRLTMHRPRLSTQIRIARIYLQMGVTEKQIRSFTKEQEMKFLLDHGKDVSLMIAMAVLCTSCRCMLFGRPLSWIIRHWMDGRYLMPALTQYVMLLGSRGFTTIISSIEATNPLRPRLSQESKGS